MGSGAGAGDNGNGKMGNSDENSSALQMQKSETNVESPDGIDRIYPFSITTKS